MPAAISSSLSVTDSCLLKLSVKDLNRRLQGLPKSQVAEVKRKRRTLKNRGYAQSCRVKKQGQRRRLEGAIEELGRRLEAANAELERTRALAETYRRRLLQDGIISKEPEGERLEKVSG